MLKTTDIILWWNEYGFCNTELVYKTNPKKKEVVKDILKSLEEGTYVSVSHMIAYHKQQTLLDSEKSEHIKDIKKHNLISPNKIDKWLGL